MMEAGTPLMNEPEIVDQFARVAKPRLSELIKLNVQHIYDWTPGDTKSMFVAVQTTPKLV